MTKQSTQYDPKQTEDRLYSKWEEAGVFTGNAESVAEPFVISMPPPNATGELHIGHALFLTIQDILIRWERMRGKEAVWVPGTDHAAIATESVVIKKLQKEGVINPRQELGREELLGEIAQYVAQSRDTIRSQIRKMGASCDWTRERYTMDPALNRCVNEVFKKMYDDGLIYRGSRIVHWDPKLATTVSDDEIEWQQEKTPLYTLKYGPFEIATARPETKFGDKYVVMHPDDARYSQYKEGDTFTAEWITGPVTATVIKDSAIDPEFGTGVMTITPWHDATDFAIAERHTLDKEQIIDFEGKLLPIAGEFAGQKITEARPKIVQTLAEKGLVVKIDESYVHNTAHNSRGKGKIEPQIKLQWFVDVNKEAVAWRGNTLSLKQVLQDVVSSGEITIAPERFNKVYFRWIDSLHDWCISRQIWWGHRIPVWYNGDEIYVGSTAPSGEGWEQDPDTLDTWFSSALWTWSTLVDPGKAADTSLSLAELLAQSPDFQKFHPTQVMETGYDIIFFWVARMILMTTYAVGQIPFEKVFLHGLVSAKGGKKMSKSDPDTVIDPLVMIEKYGADALRFGLMYQMKYGAQVIQFDETAVRTARNFANKVWNLGRLIASLPQRKEKSVADEWIEAKVERVAAEVTQQLHDFHLGEAALTLHHFIWNDFADWYVEILKVEGSREVAQQVFRRILSLLHPFMPHLTESLWTVHGGEGLLAVSTWYEGKASQKESTKAKETAQQVDYFQDVVSTVRSARILLGIQPGNEIAVSVADTPALLESFQTLTRSTVGHAKAGVPMKQFPLQSGGVVQISSEEITPASIAAAKERLVKEQTKLTAELTKMDKIIAGMKKKATAEAVAEKESELAALQSRAEELAQSLDILIS